MLGDLQEFVAGTVGFEVVECILLDHVMDKLNGRYLYVTVAVQKLVMSAYKNVHVCKHCFL